MSNLRDFFTTPDEVQLLSGKSVAGGYASLDNDGLIPLSEIPSSIVSGVTFGGSWNAATNTPTITTSQGTQGTYYVVSVDGSTSIDGIDDWVVGDWAIFNGTVWQKVDNTDKVVTVAGRAGAVVLNSADVGLANVANVDTTNAANITTGILADIRIASTLSRTDHNHVSVYEPLDVGIQTHISNVTTNPHNVAENVSTQLSLGVRTGITMSISSDGDDVSLLAASTTDAGLLTSTQFDLLASVAAGATNYIHPVDGSNTTILEDVGLFISGISINTMGHTTSVTARHLGPDDIPILASSKVGLGNVTNTADSDKIISILTQDALNLKSDIYSPALTGVPLSTTPLTADDSLKIATTAFVKAQAYVTSSGVTSVTGTSPIVSGGGVTPAISIIPATPFVAGSMSSADKVKLDGVINGLLWSVKAASVTAVAGDGIFVDTTVVARIITLPIDPIIGDTVGISDYAGTFITNNTTIARNGQLIMGQAIDFVCDVANMGLTFVYADAIRGWIITSSSY